MATTNVSFDHLNLGSRGDISALMAKTGEVIIYSDFVSKLNRVDKKTAEGSRVD